MSDYGYHNVWTSPNDEPHGLRLLVRACRYRNHCSTHT